MNVLVSNLAGMERLFSLSESICFFDGDHYDSFQSSDSLVKY